MFIDLVLVGIIVWCIIKFKTNKHSTQKQIETVYKKTHLVDIRTQKRVIPSILIINQGDSVVFRNKSYIRHTMINDEPDIINSPLLKPNETYQTIINRKGVYIFTSSLYPESKIKVRIIVK